MLIVVPDLIRTIVERKICGTDRSTRAVAEHKNILDAIALQDVSAAEAAMNLHLEEIMKVSREYKTVLL